MSGVTETRYAKTPDGCHIAYQVIGSGPMDLLLAVGSHVSIGVRDEEPRWYQFDRRLASFSRLIRFDLRGIGLSDPISPAAPPSIEDWVVDAMAVLDAVGSERAALLGHARGGQIALLLSATHPERVSAQVVAHAAARWLRAPDYPFGVPTHLHDALVNGLVEPDAGAERVDDISLVLPSLADDARFRAWWQRAGQAGASPAVARALYLVDAQVDLRPILATITAPTLILHRRDNRFCRVGHARYLAENIARAHYVELAGADHFLWAGDTTAVLDEIETFLTGATHPPEPERVLVTVVFTDIVDSTKRAVAVGDRRWRELLDAHDHLVRRQLERFRGRELKTTGDGFLAAFDGPARAIRCAQTLRDAARQLGIEVRAGIHTGEVELRGDDMAGIAMHIGQRVSALAAPGEVLASRTVVDLVAGSGIQFADRGEHELKGVPGTWRLFAVQD